MLELEDPGPLAPRSFKVTPTAPMGGGTQLFEGAHLTGGICAFVADQAILLLLPRIHKYRTTVLFAPQL